MKEADLLN